MDAAAKHEWEIVFLSHFSHSRREMSRDFALKRQESGGNPFSQVDSEEQNQLPYADILCRYGVDGVPAVAVPPATAVAGRLAAMESRKPRCRPKATAHV